MNIVPAIPPPCIEIFLKIKCQGCGCFLKAGELEPPKRATGNPYRDPYCWREPSPMIKAEKIFYCRHEGCRYQGIKYKYSVDKEFKFLDIKGE